jgi:hypothetical protein
VLSSPHSTLDVPHRHHQTLGLHQFARDLIVLYRPEDLHHFHKALQRLGILLFILDLTICVFRYVVVNGLQRYLFKRCIQELRC